jgi:hypothetical protein
MSGGLVTQIDKKNFNSPGYCEGLLAASNIYEVKRSEDLEQNWPLINYFLLNYQYFKSQIAGGIKVITIRPFRAEKDRALAKQIMQR